MSDTTTGQGEPTADKPVAYDPFQDSLGPLSGVDEPGQTLVFDSTLKPSSFLGLSLKNGLLNIVTLTLWRFWGKTEVRRRVWQGVRLNGDAFEYTGRGIELFVGFLLALLVLGLPFLLVVFGAQFMGPLAAALLILPLYFSMFWLWGFGVFTAFRYMASRTTWRGVRFRLGGSATAYGFKYIGALFLSGITLGWYWPTAERNLAESLWDEVRFGNRRVRFRMERAEKEGVYGAYAVGWFLSALPYLGLFAALFAIAYFTGSVAAPQVASAGPAPSPQSMEIAQVILTYLAILVVSPLVLLIWAPYQAAMLRSIAAGVTIDSAGFKLNVKAISLWWLTVSNLAAILFTLGFLMPWVQARTAKYMVERLTSAGTARLDEAQQTGTGPGSGEGLADAFGFSLI